MGPPAFVRRPGFTPVESHPWLNISIIAAIPGQCGRNSIEDFRMLVRRGSLTPAVRPFVRRGSLTRRPADGRSLMRKLVHLYDRANDILPVFRSAVAKTPIDISDHRSFLDVSAWPRLFLHPRPVRRRPALHALSCRGMPIRCILTA